MKPQNKVKKEIAAIGRLILKPILIGGMTFLVTACPFEQPDPDPPRVINGGDETETPVVNDKFYYKEENGAFYTYLERPTGEDVRFIHWDSNYFAPSGYTPEVRAKMVTARLNKYFNPEDPPEITWGKMNGYDIICVTDANRICKGLLYTLKPAQKGEVALELFQRQLEAPTTDVPLREAECKTYISIKAVYEGDKSNIAVTDCR